MIDINYSLQIAYQTALTGIDDVPVFFNGLPPNISPDSYIVHKNFTHTDASTMNSVDLNSQVTIEIQTFEDGINSGQKVAMITREVFNRVYPYPGFVLTVDGAQMVSTRLLNDITNQAINVGNRAYISRFLTFGHKIYLRSDIS